MYRFLKLIHLLGVVLFAGGISAAVLAVSLFGAMPDARPPAALETAMVVLRAMSQPGLTLAGLTGAAMMMRGRLSAVKLPWLGAHAGLAAVAAVLTFAVVLPAAHELWGASSGAAQAIAQAQGAAQQAWHTLRVVAVVTLLLSSGSMGLAVLKPRWLMRGGQ